VAEEVRLQVIQQVVSLVAVAVQIKVVALQLIQRCLVVVELHLPAEQKRRHVHQMVRNTPAELHVVVVLKVEVAVVLVTSAAVEVIQVAKQMAAVAAVRDS
jgi:hypothetical protein